MFMLRKRFVTFHFWVYKRVEHLNGAGRNERNMNKVKIIGRFLSGFGRQQEPFLLQEAGKDRDCASGT